jgi:hypothetical protein
MELLVPDSDVKILSHPSNHSYLSLSLIGSRNIQIARFHGSCLSVATALVIRPTTLAGFEFFMGKHLYVSSGSVARLLIQYKFKLHAVGLTHNQLRWQNGGKVEEHNMSGTIHHHAWLQ